MMSNIQHANIPESETLMLVAMQSSLSPLLRPIYILLPNPYNIFRFVGGDWSGVYHFLSKETLCQVLLVYILGATVCVAYSKVCFTSLWVLAAPACTATALHPRRTRGQKGTQGERGGERCIC